MKKILLTFDAEEFDLPKEFGKIISEEEMQKISRDGMDKIISFLREQELNSTFFTTAVFAKKNPVKIKKISDEQNEIASHGYSHSDDYSENSSFSKIQQAKQEIEKIIRKPVKGFRAPRFKIKNISELSKFGFLYDSSIHPTLAPGKYLNFNQKRKIHQIGDITEIPLSTLPLFPFFRAPFNWYIFRHFPMMYGKIFASINFSFSPYLMLIFHPWEFVDLREHDLPKAFKKNSGDKLLKKLEKYIKFCKKKNYRFETIEKFLRL